MQPKQVWYLAQVIIDQVQEVQIAQVVREGNGHLPNLVVPQVDHLNVRERPPAQFFDISYLIHMQMKLKQLREVFDDLRDLG